MKNETPSTELFLPIVLARGGCKKHKVPDGVPCFHPPKGNGVGYFAGICNHRARLAGFVGKISPGSFNRVSGAPRFSKTKKK